MELTVRFHDADLKQAVRAYIAWRLRFALARFGARAGKVEVRLSDDNGPRGGSANSCRIRVQLLPAGAVAVEETDVDLLAAIDRATERMGRAFRRRVERVRDTPGDRRTIRHGNGSPRKLFAPAR